MGPPNLSSSVVAAPSLAAFPLVFLSQKHVSHSPNLCILVQLDSLSTFNVIHYHNLFDNASLISTNLLKADALNDKNKTLILHWIPGQGSLAENEKVDHEAYLARSLKQVPFLMSPSLIHIR